MYDVLFVVPAVKATMYDCFHGTLLLATILKQKGLSVAIHHFYEACEQGDLEAVMNEIDFHGFIDDTANMILRKQPKIVSFYCRCDCYLANLLIAQKLKEARPEMHIVFGGPQADASARDTLTEVPWVDFCCSGEGETTVYPLFSALLNGTDYTQVPGLAYRNAAGEIVENADAPLVADLDTLPGIDFGFVPKAASDYTYQKKMMAAIEVGRGCPFNCAYCSSSLFWKRKFRMKSARRIVDEMLEIYNRFGIKRFVFEHDLFTASKKKVMEFTDLLKQTDVDFEWSCSCRVDTLDEEMVQAMAETGLEAVYLGVESGSERMQKLMNKNLKVQDVDRVCALLKKYHIKFWASFIYALPEETEEDLEQSIRLAYRLYKLGASSFQFHLCVIFPGTEYYHRYADSIVISTTQSDIVGDFGFHENQAFIQQHPKLFSFSYEYRSELREKYPDLADYIVQVFRLYDLLNQLIPEKFKDKKFTELAYELIHMYEALPKGRNAYEIARDYGERYLTGEEQRKALVVMAYLSDREKATRNPDFMVDFKTYSINISDVIDGKPLTEIQERNCMVCFKKEKKQVFSHVKLL